MNMYDPITLRARAEFRYFGAAVPLLFCSAVLYYVLMRLFVVPGTRGGYRIDANAVPGQADPVEVSL
jgi:hypothetical protein